MVLAALLAIFLPSHLNGDDKATIDATRLSLGGLHLAQIAFGVLGVLVMTNEYDRGMIRTTFSAAPRRRLVLAAKAIVTAATALIVGVVASFAAFFVFQACLTDASLRSSLGDPGVLRAVTGGGLYVAALALLGLGLGTILRAGSGAIAAFFGALFVPPMLMQLLPHAWQEALGPYSPLEAGSRIFSVQPHGALGPWSGFGVLCLYVVVALGVGAVVITRRDA